MEDHIITQDSVKSCALLTKEDEREKVKDFVYRHLMNDRAVLNRGHFRAQQGAVFSGKILSFGCSVCKDSSTYSPNDLLKHFRAAHRGILPTYPCDLCGFVTNEFSVLQRHRIEHRDTLVTCELCHDGVQYSLLLLTRHYNMCHSLNGQFTCTWCHFTTVDAGTFVQHIHHHKETTWKCAKCSHVSLDEAEHKKHLKSHSGTFPFTCPMCGYGCARNDYLKKHMAAVHKSEKKSVWTAIEDNGAPLNSPSGLKLLLKKTSPQSGESKDDNQISKLNAGCGVKEITNEKLALTNEVTGESHHKAQDTLAKKDSRNGKNVSNEQEPSTVDILPETEHTLSSELGQISPNGRTVLRVKNKLSLPPNCTTKVIGFKMVDGKKHLVLKVIQASQQDGGVQQDPKEISNGRNSSLDCLRADDIMTVKVKVEEEETTVTNLDSNPNGDLNCSPFSDGHIMLNNCDKDTSPHQQTACSQKTVTEENTAQVSDSECTNESSAQESQAASVDNSKVAEPGGLSHTQALEKHVQSKQTTSDSCSNQSETNGQENVVETCSNLSRAEENRTTQEVFTFHNYSKDTTSSPEFGNSFEFSAEREAVSPDFRLTLAESPDPGKAIREPAVDESVCGQRNSECSSNVEVDGCVSDVEVEENPESVLQDFNIIKIEEDNIPITKPPSNQLSPAADGSVNEHSDIQQASKDTAESAGSSENGDSTKQPKTTLRILQLPEGKQPILLRTAAESRFAVPLQVKAPPGFKLITNSTNPHINVSYMKPGDKTSNSGVVIGSNSKVIGVPAGKGAALLTSSKQGITNSSNHYLITSDLKRPLILPRVLNGASSDKTKTCYVVQRSSLPGQSPPAQGLKLSGAQLSLNSRPLLAVPVSSAENSGNLQSGRQTFLLRYVPPSKSGLTVSSQDAKILKATGSSAQSNDSTGNKLIFKIVSPPNTLSNSATVSQSHPVLLATRPQTQCFLLSSNNAAGIKKIIAVQNSSQNFVSEARLVHSSVKLQSSDADKPVRAPRPVRPPSQRKRRRKLLFDELPVANQKVRKLLNKALPEKEPDLLWSPVAKDKERTLRLSPQSSDQLVSWPRKHQPVVVLNHPDADIPEVANIMKVVQRHQGAVTKVSLSEKTIQALSHSATESSTKETSHNDCPHPRTVQSSVRERYLLKLKLKRKNRKKYRLVRTAPDLRQSAVFTCWFCGRLFNNQEAWIGHGQRHLLEATRDWNTLE